MFFILVKDAKKLLESNDGAPTTRNKLNVGWAKNRSTLTPPSKLRGNGRRN